MFRDAVRPNWLYAGAQDVILVSNNTREFSRVDKLKMENWVNERLDY